MQDPFLFVVCGLPTSTTRYKWTSFDIWIAECQLSVRFGKNKVYTPHKKVRNVQSVSCFDTCREVLEQCYRFCRVPVGWVCRSIDYHFVGAVDNLSAAVALIFQPKRRLNFFDLPVGNVDVEFGVSGDQVE